MICCLNPDCDNPCSPEGTRFCPNCGIGLVMLRSRYRPIRSIGGGGFAKTYLAEDIDKLNEPCVIKQFAPQVQGTGPLHKAKELFEQEARRLQQLGGHPQIPTLFAYFEQDYRLFLVQQYIDGQNLLAELQQQGTFSEQKIWELLLDLLNILKSVHQQQVIHRDIKPHNILRRSSPPTTPLIQEGTGGDLVLIDFGASKQLTATVMSQPGTTIGSFGYVPIEQMQDGQAYPASDLYSLGATCFHLLTGISPWELWKRQGYGWVANWRQHLPQPVSQELGRILDKLLQEDYHQRYHSAQEVLQDLIPATSPRPPIPIPQPPASPPPKVPLSVQSSPQPLPTPSAASLKQNVKLKKLLLMGSAILLVVFGGYKVLQTTNDLPVKTVPYENLALAKTLTKHKAPVYALAISPSGQTLVSGSWDKTIKIWHLLTGELQQTLPYGESEINALAISPDGQTLVSGSSDKTIKIWHLLTGKLQYTLPGHEDAVNALAISPDGQTLVSGSRDKTIKIWNLKTGELKNTLTKHTNSVTSLAFSRDGQTLVSADRNGTINIWNLNTGALKTSLTQQKETVWVVLISPDSQTLIGGINDKTIKIWDLQTGNLKKTLTGHTDWVGSLIISPDGQTLISGSGDKTIKIWDLQTGNLKKTLHGHTKGVVSLAISPDGKTLVSGSEDNTIKIWQILQIL